jgi:hypothetical protein
VSTSDQPRLPSLEELGLPDHSAFTIEGRIERASMMATHELRRRKGLERDFWRSDWMPAMVQILGVLALVIAAAVVLARGA